MALDDTRLEWIKQRVYSAFYLPEPNSFEELLSRRDGEEERKILQFLNQVSEEEFTSALLFFKRIWEEQVEMVITTGTHGLLQTHLYFNKIQKYRKTRILFSNNKDNPLNYCCTSAVEHSVFRMESVYANNARAH